MTADRYSRTAMTLHWLIALALAFQLALGWRLEEMPRGPALFSAYQLHKSVGITILLLTLVRIIIRFAHKRPPLPVDSKWAQWLAKFVHFGLYLVMIGGPLTGWAIVSTAKVKVPTLIFGIIPWPHLPLPESWHDPSEGWHTQMAFIGIALFLLHVVGALRHQFMKGEPLLHRMLPFASLNAALAAVGGVAAIAGSMVLAKHWSFAVPSKATAAPTGQIASNDVSLQTPAAIEEPEKPTAEEGPLNAITPQADLAKAKALEEATKLDPKAAKLAVANAEAETSKTPMPLADWQIAPGGKLGFTASWSGIPIDGRFNSWSGAIKFSPDALDKTDIRITIDLGSANTADSQRDSNLKSEQFFNTSSFPQAIFTANKARSLGGDRYAADGSLSLRGVSQPVSINFMLKITGNDARVSGGTQLNRLDYGVGTGEYAKTDEIAGSVPVNFAFQARRK